MPKAVSVGRTTHADFVATHCIAVYVRVDGIGSTGPPAAERDLVPSHARRRRRADPADADVDQAAHDRGRALWARECIDCHGSQARGSETGPNIIRTKTVNFDRSSPTPGSVLGPFLKAGHPDAERQGERDASPTRRSSASRTSCASASTTRCAARPSSRSATSWSATRRRARSTSTAPADAPSCHNATTRSLAGIGGRMPAPVDHPAANAVSRRGGGGRGRGAAAPTAPNRDHRDGHARPPGPRCRASSSSRAISIVTLRQADGTIRAVRTSPDAKVVTDQSAAGAHRPARRDHRHADP